MAPLCTHPLVTNIYKFTCFIQTKPWNEQVLLVTGVEKAEVSKMLNLVLIIFWGGWGGGEEAGVVRPGKELPIRLRALSICQSWPACPTVLNLNWPFPHDFPQATIKMYNIYLTGQT